MQRPHLSQVPTCSRSIESVSWKIQFFVFLKSVAAERLAASEARPSAPVDPLKASLHQLEIEHLKRDSALETGAGPRTRASFHHKSWQTSDSARGLLSKPPDWQTSNFSRFPFPLTADIGSILRFPAKLVMLETAGHPQHVASRHTGNRQMNTTSRPPALMPEVEIEDGSIEGITRRLGYNAYLLNLILRPQGRWGTFDDLKISSTAKFFMALGGGTGASLSGVASKLFGEDLIQRMRLQDTAVILLMTAVYFAALLVTASVAYRQAHNNSSVTFYSDPRYHSMFAEGYELETFLDAFCQPPKNVYLHAAGFTRTTEAVPGIFYWQGYHYSIDFTFSLDLSAWVVREGSNEAVDPSSNEASVPVAEGIVAEDLDKLTRFLGHDVNDLAIVEVSKEIAWPHWEELAMNIKHRIRQCDYEGMIGVDRTKHESVCVYKNRRWTNFMHSRIVKVILALSIVGWVVYLPYLWIRSSRLHVRCLYQVNISISDYWQLIAAHLTANGFITPGDTDVALGSSGRWGAPSMEGNSTSIDPRDDSDDGRR